jgi:hypothetical protein
MVEVIEVTQGSRIEPCSDGSESAGFRHVHIIQVLSEDSRVLFEDEREKRVQVIQRIRESVNVGSLGSTEGVGGGGEWEYDNSYIIRITESSGS